MHEVCCQQLKVGPLVRRNKFGERSPWKWPPHFTHVLQIKHARGQTAHKALDRILGKDVDKFCATEQVTVRSVGFERKIGFSPKRGKDYRPRVRQQKRVPETLVARGSSEKGLSNALSNIRRSSAMFCVVHCFEELYT